MGQVNTKLNIRNHLAVVRNVSKTLQPVSDFFKALTETLKPKSAMEVIQNYDARTIAFHLNPVEKAQVQTLRMLCQTNPQLAVDLAYQRLQTPRNRIHYHKADLPEGAEAFSIPYRQGKIRGYSWGKSDKRIYLVHGWESTLSLFSQTIEALKEAGYQVIAFDAPGHGKSDRQKTGLADFIQLLKHVISLKGSAYAIIGHSCGAAATTIMLKQHPELSPKKVVLLAPMSSMKTKLKIFNEIANLPKDIQGKIEERLERDSGMSLEDLDLAEASKAITVPALIIHDQNDSLIPYKNSLAIARNWKGSSFKSCSGLDHIRLLFNQAIVKQVSQFVRGENLE